MSRAQRLTFLGIAAVIAVVAVVLITRGDATTDTARTPTATPTPSAAATEAGAEETATPEPTPTPDPVKTLRAGKVTKLTFTEGDTVRFEVASDVPEEIHVHGYDVEDAVQPGKPLRVSFDADITGVFEIELHGSGEQIGRLSVEPQ